MKQRILLIDIETFPILGYVWQVFDANVLRVEQPTTICAFSAKWLDGKQVTKALPDYPNYKAGGRDDSHLMQDLWALLDEADIVVAHNGNRFDIKKINSRFLVHGLTPPSPYRTVDTLLEARRVAAYDSNRLNELGKILELGEKMKTGGADLWFNCLAGDMKSWRHMKRYNAQDVVLLEKLYKRLLPWMRMHPNVATGLGPNVCPTCGSYELQARGTARNKTTAYPRFQCQGCGAWCRGTENILPKEQKPFVAL